MSYKIALYTAVYCSWRQNRQSQQRWYMFRQKTAVRLTHKTVHHQYGGGQTGSLSEVISQYTTDRVTITSGAEPMRLTCACGDSYMFRLLSKQEHRRLFWRTLGRRLLILTVAYALTSVGAFLAFSAGHDVWLRVIGGILYAPGLITSLVMFFRAIFGLPKRFTLEPCVDNTSAYVGSIRTYHGVKLS